MRGLAEGVSRSFTTFASGIQERMPMVITAGTIHLGSVTLWAGCTGGTGG